MRDMRSKVATSPQENQHIREKRSKAAAEENQQMRELKTKAGNDKKKEQWHEKVQLS